MNEQIKFECPIRDKGQSLVISDEIYTLSIIQHLKFANTCNRKSDCCVE